MSKEGDQSLETKSCIGTVEGVGLFTLEQRRLRDGMKLLVKYLKGSQTAGDSYSYREEHFPSMNSYFKKGDSI